MLWTGIPTLFKFVILCHSVPGPQPGNTSHFIILFLALLIMFLRFSLCFVILTILMSNVYYDFLIIRIRIVGFWKGGRSEVLLHNFKGTPTLHDLPLLTILHPVDVFVRVLSWKDTLLFFLICIFLRSWEESFHMQSLHLLYSSPWG